MKDLLIQPKIPQKGILGCINKSFISFVSNYAFLSIICCFNIVDVEYLTICTAPSSKIYGQKNDASNEVFLNLKTQFEASAQTKHMLKFFRFEFPSSNVQKL